jgi:CheY-like chemotaxis protein
VRITSANVQIEEPMAGQHPPMAPGSYVMLTVSDSGVGMDAETQARIFEPFFTTKDPERGTGLGLPTVYGIVKQSGGYIWVESQLGQGTTFTLYFPSAELTVLPASNLEPVPATTGTRPMQATVLVVEDEPGVRELATTILQVHGCHVLSASRASEGLQLAERYTGPIDLVLTDVVMPGMSGRQLAEELLRQRPNLRVLYMSGYTRAMLQPDPGAGAASGYLQKPFAPATLAERVAQLLGT